MTDPPWAGCFINPDDKSKPASICLRQVSQKTFVLESSMRYSGPTGVKGLPEKALTLRPHDLGPGAFTDLTSVPVALRWFVGPYGAHTPAALLHDRLIGEPGWTASPTPTPTGSSDLCSRNSAYVLYAGG